jgi:hypothetical protein
MKTLRIIYHMRLGDVIRCLPIAKYFADRGWRVELETLPEYHGVRELVSYCNIIPPGDPLPDRVLDLQIWPRRAPEFEASGMTWQQYVYTLFPEGKEIDPTIILFDKLPPWRDIGCNEFLCFPTGYSQRSNPPPGTVLHTAHKLFPGCGIVAMGPGYHMEASIYDYARRVQQAAGVLTINSSASIVCSAVRASWHHVISRHPNEEWHDPRQIRVAIQ